MELRSGLFESHMSGLMKSTFSFFQTVNYIKDRPYSIDISRGVCFAR